MLTSEIIIAIPNDVQNDGIYNPGTSLSVSMTIQVFIIRIKKPNVTKLIGKARTIIIGRIITLTKVNINAAITPVSKVFMLIISKASAAKYNTIKFAKKLIKNLLI